MSPRDLSQSSRIGRSRGRRPGSEILPCSKSQAGLFRRQSPDRAMDGVQRGPNAPLGGSPRQRSDPEEYTQWL